MDYGKVLKQTGKLVWNYRVLWIFGAILALTTVNGFYFGYGWNRDESQKGIAVKITDDNIIYIPGDGLTIDLTGPNGASIWFDDGGGSCANSRTCSPTCCRGTCALSWLLWASW
jgi:hypothetical protein